MIKLGTDELKILYSYHATISPITSIGRDNLIDLSGKLSLLSGEEISWLEISRLFSNFIRINKHVEDNSVLTDYEIKLYNDIKILKLDQDSTNLKEIYESFKDGSYRVKDSKIYFTEIEEEKSSELNFSINNVEIEPFDSDLNTFKIKGKIKVQTENYLRTKKIAQTALMRADYKCEINNKHHTFINRLGRQYMEAHHLIPLSYQEFFDTSLDVIANVVSLCPNCHREIHYGSERNNLLAYLYKVRKNNLEESNILMSYVDLVRFYN